jgi:hypothetical protein
MSASSSLSAAVTFVWLGMVLAISFLETPLKFRAPEVTLQIGLGIGRLIFRALNVAEVVFASALLVAIAIDHPPERVVTSVMAAIVILMVQITAVRPLLTGRSDRVLAGEEVPRSVGHYGYIALEVAKVIALLTSGVLLLAA